MRDKSIVKKEILSLVKEFSEIENSEKRPYKDGGRVPYCSRVYDETERMNLVDSALEFWLTAGRYADKFEKDLAEFLGIEYAYAVNSGSAANLLAFMSLTAPELGDRAINRGDEVITVAAAFPTSVSPIIQYGAIPVFVDIEIPSYNIDTTRMEEALSKKTKAVMLAHSLGTPFNLQAVKDFCKKNKLWLIEDNCDALGAEYLVDGVFRKTGTIGDIGTSSFYPAHHITMGEGGAVYTSNKQIAKILLSMRDWGRDCVCPPGKDDTCGHRFDAQYGLLPVGYDHKYVYSHFGYNLKITDMQASIGCAQLEKASSFIEKRRKHWRILREGLADLKDVLVLPEENQNSKISPFGFICTIKENASVSRNEIVHSLESKGIQTRNLFSGNILLHPCFDSIRNTDAYRVCGDLSNTDIAMNRAFWIGVYPGLQQQQLDWMIRCVREGILHE